MHFRYGGYVCVCLWDWMHATVADCVSWVSTSRDVAFSVLSPSLIYVKVKFQTTPGFGLCMVSL